VAERNACEAQTDMFALLAVDRERGLALVVIALFAQRDLVRKFGDFLPAAPRVRAISLSSSDATSSIGWTSLVR
jgi:hypothetical protein